MSITQLKEWRHTRCDDEPMSQRCTDRLHDGQCPGQDDRCCSSKFDPAKHNAALPIFFAAQH
jgi:hypothetical protein